MAEIRAWTVLAVCAALVVPAVNASPAVAVTLDGPVRACLESAIGVKETQRIARASRLSAQQRRQVAACRRSEGASGSGSTSGSGAVVWRSDGQGGWVTSSKPPACSPIEWRLPLDGLGGVQGVLEPGQVRGGRYKGHGGFRMAGSLATVRSPIDGYLVSASAYRETAQGVPGPGGEVQYLLEIQHPCGFIVRFDHLKVLDPIIAAGLSTVPVRDDSQGTLIQPPLRILRGQVLATTVGHTETGANPSFDFGVYDARAPQSNRRSEAELRSFGPDGQLGMYAVCWFDLFGTETAAGIRALPRGYTEAGQGSDVCR